MNVIRICEIISITKGFARKYVYQKYLRENETFQSPFHYRQVCVFIYVICCLSGLHEFYSYICWFKKNCMVLIAHSLKILLSFYLKRNDLILVFFSANVIYQKKYLKKMRIQRRRLSTPLIMA